MWQKINETLTTRKYRNPVTGSECSTTKVYTDKDGNSWWEFDNLFTIPYLRQFAATKIASLYQVGLSKDDITNHINSLKNILKSQDNEKYEKAMQHILTFEERFNDATNAVRQMSSLVCVYNVMNDERVDLFDNATQDIKLAILEADHEAHAFFLKRQIERTETYGTAFDQLSKIASTIKSDTLVPTDLKLAEPNALNGTFK